MEFERDPVFAKGLRYIEHPNSEVITIHYATERRWSKKHRQAEHEGLTTEGRIVQATKKIFQDAKVLFHANKTVSGNPIGPQAIRLPNKPHGLNTYSDIDNIVFLSSLNPPPDHFRFLESRGLSGYQVRRCIYHSTVYQTVLRTSIRDPNNINPKRIIVPDREAADYLQDVFPQAKLEKLDIGLIDEPSKRGRPRRHSSNAQRVAEQRAKDRKRKLQLLEQQLRLNSQDKIEDGWRNGGDSERSNLRAENGIRLFYSIFGTQVQRLTATIYSHKQSSTPFAYISCETNANLVGLRDVTALFPICQTFRNQEPQSSRWNSVNLVCIFFDCGKFSRC